MAAADETEMFRVCVSAVEGSVGEDRLFTELFETRNYNKYSYPVISLSETIHVRLGIMLVKIVEVVCTASPSTRYKLKWTISGIKSRLAEVNFGLFWAKDV